MIRVPGWLYHLSQIITPHRSVLLATAFATGTAGLLWSMALRAGDNLWLYLLATLVPAIETSVVWQMAVCASREGKASVDPITLERDRGASR